MLLQNKMHRGCQLLLISNEGAHLRSRQLILVLLCQLAPAVTCALLLFQELRL